jgi:hypothetical protein
MYMFQDEYAHYDRDESPGSWNKRILSGERNGVIMTLGAREVKMRKRELPEFLS